MNNDGRIERNIIYRFVPMMCHYKFIHIYAFIISTLLCIKHSWAFTISTSVVIHQHRPTISVVHRYAKNDQNDNDDDFMAALRSRVKEVEDRETKLPLVVLDSMLPRQVLKIQVKNDLFIALVQDCILKESPFFGMLGMARLQTGQQVHLKHGVEVEIVGIPKFTNDIATGGENGGGMMLELKAGRRFIIEGEVDNVEKGWTEARVQFLVSETQEEEEIKGVDDRLSVARAMSKAKELTSPNVNMPDNLSLVDRWIQLAKLVEREPGQIDRLLEQLGDIPPAEEPSERALWVGALINPIPAMGVAMEIRPQLLLAKKAEDRVQVALDGIFRSIKHMDGSAKMW